MLVAGIILFILTLVFFIISLTNFLNDSPFKGVVFMFGFIIALMGALKLVGVF